MSNLKDQISEEIKMAMKAKDKTRLNALRYLKKLFIENDTSTKKQDEQDIVISYTKKVKDSLEMYPKDSEQYKEITAEIEVLSEFMPKPLSEEDVLKIIDDIISGQENANFGLVMKELSGKIKGRFDGKKATNLVKDKLAK